MVDKMCMVIILHDIAVPKGLYFTAVVFTFFLLSFKIFIRCQISEVTEWISTNAECIHLWQLFEK